MPHTAPTRRRWHLRRVERELGGLHVAHEFEPDFERALERVQTGAETVVVTGSFHTVGDALARLPGFAPVPEIVAIQGQALPGFRDFYREDFAFRNSIFAT